MEHKSKRDLITDIESHLVDALKALLLLNEENFSDNFNFAKINISYVRNLNKKFAEKYADIGTVEKITTLTKQISGIYDDIVRMWQNKVNIVESELETIQNQKKIANYNR